MPPETFPTAHLDVSSSHDNLPVDTRLFVDFDVEVKLAFLIQAIYR
jgi:hypothetical protein